MGVDLTKVFKQTCEILIAARTDPATETDHSDENGGGENPIWFHAGTVKAGSGKFSFSENNIELQTGNVKVSGNYGIECSAIEIDDTAVDALEALEGADCDIILQPVDAVDTVSSARKKILGVKPRLQLEGSFDGKDLITLKLVADAVKSANTSFIKDITADWILAPTGVTLSWPYASHVYLAPRVSAGTPVAHTTNSTWVDVGAYKAGSGKLNYNESSVDTTRGKIVISKTMGLELSALETDDAKNAALVALEGKICDVLLVPVNASLQARLKLFAIVPRLGVDGGFDGKDAPGFAMKADGVFETVSDFVTVTTADWRL